MPSLATTAQQSVFTQLLYRSGEDVTFRDVAVKALINRAGPKPGARLPANVALQTGAVIQFPATVSKPIPGEVVTDDQSINHTIGEVKFLGFCWECQCETNV
jgi:hypothetical protein